MNARNVCLVVLMSTGLVLSAKTADARAIDSGLEEALATIKQEQIADFHGRAIQEFPQRDIDVAPPGFVSTGLADEAIAKAEDGIRLQGQFALWSIEEELRSCFSTGRFVQALTEEQAGMVVATVDSNDDSAFGKAKSLFKTARFEWPEFMPASLR